MEKTQCFQHYYKINLRDYSSVHRAITSQMSSPRLKFLAETNLLLDCAKKMYLVTGQLYQIGCRALKTKKPSEIIVCALIIVILSRYRIKA